MKAFLSLGFVCALAVPAVAAETAVSGVVDFLKAPGVYATERAALILPEKFVGELRLESGAQTLRTKVYRFSRAASQHYLHIAFSALPGAKENTTLILSGAYTPGREFRGECFTRVAATAEDASNVLVEFMAGGSVSSFVLTGTFRFGNKIAAPTRRGVRVTGSGDPNNPCPDGPCWSTGGVGRRAEYYAGGPIQNPGRPSVAATFERGVPYATTRRGQLDAQAVGLQRAELLRRSLYQNRGWWFGFFFW